MDLSFVGNLDSSCSLTIDSHARNRGVGEHGEVRPIHQGKGIRPEHGETLAVTDSKIENGGSAIALHHAPVVILEGWNPHRTRSIHHGRSYRVGIRRGLDKDQSSGSAVLWVRSAMPFFDAAVDVQYRLVVPCRVVRLFSEEIPVVLVPAGPDHHVDAGSTAEDLAHVQWNSASLEVRVGLACEAPVTFASEVQSPLARFHDLRHFIGAA